ncbi:hypothetical protein DYBT9275_02176 [Dyadobacter sp. CECT 9275]|uniref:Uncharacterized protein n=1 Tax=Dyadobacter helix TaxID=2822344 RepID=A0A916N470_9BACT|nr:hypothetical protein DYBT9275_02176 [Dyadobacter sp. CECT 9275]
MDSMWYGKVMSGIQGQKIVYFKTAGKDYMRMFTFCF